jgi:TonB family protein
MTTYIIKSSVSLLLLFGLYWFLLRKEKLFVFNRVFLVASVVFSLVVPFISIPVNLQTTYKLGNYIPAYNQITPEIIATDNVVQNAVNKSQPFIRKETPFINVSVVLFLLYFSGVLLFLIRFLRNLFLIAQRSRLSEKIRFNNYKIILTNDQIGPCCFFDLIFLNRQDYLNGRIDKDLLNHEMEHARQSHTFDIILIELVKVFYWFNPIYILYERAIKINHEYLADNRVISDNSDIKSYTDKLLNFITCNSNMSLTSGSNNSFTKMRLMMMMKSHSGSFKYGVRIAITICMVTIFFMLLSFKDSKYQTLPKNPSQIGVEIQQNIVNGIVLTEDGKPLIVAKVTAVGSNSTSLKSSTFPDGRFKLSGLQSGASLNIECQGFKTQTLKADFASMMTVKMVRDPDYKGKVIITEIQTANFRNSDFTPASALITINGEILDKNGEFKVNPGDIRSLRVLTDKEATNKYGDKGKDGVLEILLFGNNTDSQGKNPAVSKKNESDTSIYDTHLSINHTSNKGELIDIPVPNIQYASVWTYHDIDKNNEKDLRTIAIMTKDYFRVKGKVVGENEKPLPGVKISAPDSPAIVTSDKEGSFAIEDVREGVLLEFSCPGYKTYYLNTLFEEAFNEPLSIVLKKDGDAGKEEAYNDALSIGLKKDSVPEKENAYETADKIPQYPGGEMELLKFVAMNTQYPEAAKSDKAEGRVIIRFIVNTQGNVEKPVVLKSVHPALDNEALRVVRMLKGFTPGSQEGKPVSVYYILPITFALPNINTSK